MDFGHGLLATLGGSGTIAGAVVVGASGTLSPGTSPGILTVTRCRSPAAP